MDLDILQLRVCFRDWYWHCTCDDLCLSQSEETLGRESIWSAILFIWLWLVRLTLECGLILYTKRVGSMLVIYHAKNNLGAFSNSHMLLLVRYGTFLHLKLPWSDGFQQLYLDEWLFIIYDEFLLVTLHVEVRSLIALYKCLVVIPNCLNGSSVFGRCGELLVVKLGFKFSFFFSCSLIGLVHTYGFLILIFCKRKQLSRNRKADYCIIYRKSLCSLFFFGVVNQWFDCQQELQGSFKIRPRSLYLG